VLREVGGRRARRIEILVGGDYDGASTRSAGALVRSALNASRAASTPVRFAGAAAAAPMLTEPTSHQREGPSASSAPTPQDKNPRSGRDSTCQTGYNFGLAVGNSGLRTHGFSGSGGRTDWLTPRHVPCSFLINRLDGRLEI
jgi:hypothetical protein